MKQLKYVAVIGALLALGACDRFERVYECDCGCEEPEPVGYCGTPEYNENECVYRDPGMCGGVWFERNDGVMLEVYGCDPVAMGLRPGDRTSLIYEPYDTGDIIQCEAISEFEVRVHESGAPIRIVRLLTK